ncbi:ethanolaminephosphotransferase 1-like [Limulus polyphemus]|uniref:Ethanolaminephosphotransferase 1-like n=1 Tax=Limulus polyphemus TaxID=6850 RepID=A0ABM1AZL4_LIMPO|nr:ethanolaminephosphotransferase 1-like [Limulus polyphemus]
MSLKMTEGRYLKKEQLSGFEYYKYNSVDTSPVSNYVMHPFWNWIVKLVPLWVAPNVLTFVGFLLTVFNALLLAFYDYRFRASSDDYPDFAPIPSWVWIVCAINQFLAYTLDGIDGKHARRTNSTGPLGELMDHGIDSWSSLFMPMCLYSVFGCGEYSCRPLRVFFILWNIHICFVLSHWEKYNTGILYLPWNYDISQFMLVVAYLIAYFKSYKFWKFMVPVLNVTSGQVVEVFLHVCSLGMSLPVSLYNIYKGYKSNILKHKTFYESMCPLFPVMILFIITSLWAVFSPSDIMNTDPRIFFWMVGTVFSNICCRLIISQMSMTRCEAFNFMLYPVGLTMALVFGVPVFGQKENLILWILTVFCIVAHIYYAVSVVQEMCQHFEISCFSLKKTSKD